LSHDIVTPQVLRPVEGASRRAEELVEDVGDRVRETVQELKPLLRGWLHATTAPLALVSLVSMLVLAEGTRARLAATIFLTTAVVSFSISALFHTRPWSWRAHQVWQRLDHANIFVLIAGTMTPFSLLILDRGDALRLLSLVWAGALAGAVFKLVWIDAPRWLSVSLYLLLGSTWLLYVPEFVAAGPPDVLLLMVLGGVLYAVGALVYAFRWPDPLPSYFGFHEVFHALTVTAFAAHCCGVGLLVHG
jgi:hemolysin III